jgi:hypothetical protein
MPYTGPIRQNKECVVIKNRKLSLLNCILILLFSGVSAAVVADSLPIKPGLWKTTTVSQTPMGTQTSTSNECLKDDHFDPRKAMAEAEGCEIVKSKLSGKTLNFTMECSIQGGSASMVGSYTSKGDKGSGNVKINMSFGGQQMSSETNMTAERVGNC